jgi:hypothetical protein
LLHWHNHCLLDLSVVMVWWWHVCLWVRSSYASITNVILHDQLGLCDKSGHALDYLWW